MDQAITVKGKSLLTVKRLLRKPAEEGRFWVNPSSPCSSALRNDLLSRDTAGIVYYRCIRKNDLKLKLKLKMLFALANLWIVRERCPVTA